METCAWGSRRRHFAKILNIQSEFDEEELERVRQGPLRPELADVLSEEKVWRAVGKLRNGKADGAFRILPEMMKAACCEEQFMSRLVELVHDVWKEYSIPRDWCDAILVPIP